MSGLSQQELLKGIMAINNDASLSDAEKAAARQDLMAGKWRAKVGDADTKTGGDTESKGTKGGCGEREGRGRGMPPGCCHALRSRRCIPAPALHLHSPLPQWLNTLPCCPPSPGRRRRQGQGRGQRGGGRRPGRRHAAVRHLL